MDSTSALSSASWNLVFWNLMSGLPNASRSLVYLMASIKAPSAMPEQTAAMISRSRASCSMSW
ncbi:Uncharacterised protein [Mycobacteroides abscessus subsp. abscessus]|nr:Uncharacterised protein [Mycobacteroides abscessus subsp. abscessus]